jgi:outer membrane protein assembly factor BamE
MRLIAISVLALTTILAGCSFPGVYKKTIEQGNKLIPERVERLEVGMTRDQVQFLLGSPVTVNTFNPDRWIYLERVDYDGEVQANTYLIVEFTNDRVASIERESGGTPTDPILKVDTTPPAKESDGGWLSPLFNFGGSEGSSEAQPESVDLPSDPQSVGDTAQPDPQDATRWWWPF